MKNKKKPNFKLRRIVARIIIAIIILSLLLFLCRDLIKKASIYMSNSDHKKLISAFYSIDYGNEEVEDIINKLKESNKVSKVDSDMIKELSIKGYNKNTINFIVLNMSKTQIRKLLNKKYDKDFEEYLTIKLFNYENYNRYLEYQDEHKDMSLEDIVIRVELNQDLYNYENSVLIDNPDSYTTLVNKHRYISKDYIPSDLVDMEDKYSNNSRSTNKVRKEVYEQFKKMVDDAKEDGITFYAEKAYRSFDDQDDIYYEYLNINGSEMTSKYAAKAGYSEHQLGTAIDIANNWYIDEGDKEYKWIEKFGYMYGFILRYKSKEEDITGYAAEGCHIRYVGIDIATKIHKENISFDEYWIKNIKK